MSAIDPPLAGATAGAKPRTYRPSLLPRDWRSQTGMAVVLVVGALFMVVPFLWMFATSLSRKANVSMPRIPTLIPPDPSFFNYWIANADMPIIRLYLNSLFV